MEKQATLSKTQEAAQSQTHDAVPSYEHHAADDLYTERIQNYGSGLPDLEEDLNQTLDSYNELHLDPVPQDEDPLPPAFPSAPPSSPLSLTLSKALIFPNTVPAAALYSLNYTLNTMGNSIMLSRSVPGAVRVTGKSSKIIDKDLTSLALLSSPQNSISTAEEKVHSLERAIFK